MPLSPKQKMLVARAYDYNDIRIEEVDLPVIGPGELLVRTKACGICSGDLMPWYIRKKAPLVFGHEPAGEVVSVGEGVTGFRPGNRVFVHHHAPCFSCDYCRRGAYVHCSTWRQSAIDPGGMAEYFRVPTVNTAHDTLLLPPDMDYTTGTFVEPVACGVKAFERARVAPGDTILILGLGFMGLLLTALAKVYGAGRIIAADLLSLRCAIAARIGADYTVDVSREDLTQTVRNITGNRLADVVLVGPPTLTAWETGLECTGRGGSLVLFSPTPPGEVFQLDTGKLYFDEISVIPSYSCGPTDTKKALELLAQGSIPVEELVTNRHSLVDAAEAYRAVAEGGPAIKAVIYFD